MKRARASCGGRHNAGYTLVELLVVLAIVAMLLSIVLPRYLQATEGAKRRAQSQNLSVLRDALDKFHADHGVYPAELGELVKTSYLRDLPVDPITGSKQWSVVADPRGIEVGVWDVAPPAPGQSGISDSQATR